MKEREEASNAGWSYGVAVGCVVGLPALKLHPLTLFFMGFAVVEAVFVAEAPFGRIYSELVFGCRLF
ncbi:hypothetical protein L484_002873 [Morus notabilis]|uniref:Uncharacterized protein n=1 Tax=Morus notabilis TaxID=981085 RepID=W9RUN1_9ROSA|nr:hypothetical protein L484_002873 [Morus notabilis]